MCQICAEFRPYANSCDYEGLGLDDAGQPAPAANNAQPSADLTDGFTDAEFDAYLETVLQANDFSYSTWPFAPATGPIQLTYSFETAPTTDFPWNNVGGGFSAYTAAEEAAVRRALEEFERVINVEFVEIAPGGDADIAFFQAGDLNTDVAAVYGGRGRWQYSGDQWDGAVVFNSARDLSQDREFDLILHEIGHSLGLRHPGDYDIGGNNPNGPFLPEALDSDQYSIMSYSRNAVGNQESRELMLFDIAALQEWWGANDSYATGDDVYTARGENRFHVIWDAGGTDMIRHLNGPAHIDLRQGAFSTLSGVTDLVIGRNAVIENAQAGSFNDTLIGNSASNHLDGGLGNDALTGGLGDDTIVGGGGSDIAVINAAQTAITVRDSASGTGLIVISADGTDLIDASVEDVEFTDGTLSYAQLAALVGTMPTEFADTLTGTGAGDTIDGLGGNDTIDGLGGRDSLIGGLGDDSLIGGSNFDTLEGGAGNDTLSGGEQADLLRGGDDNDFADGGDGADQIYGDGGDDTLLGGSGADRIYGGDGDDSIDAGFNFGPSVDGVEGGAGNDTIDGGVGFDLLIGGDGNDLIRGGNQADNLYGDAGNDTLIGGNGFDRLFGGDGDDLLQDFDGLGGFFGGTGNDTIDGGDAATFIFGQQGNDVINAGGGDDRIGGNSGFDTINAGAGNDTIFGDFNADTFVFEDGHGSDVVGDFDAMNDFEKIDLSGLSTINSLADLNLMSSTSGAATQVGADVEIDTGGGNSITLVGVNLDDLDANDFIF